MEYIKDVILIIASYCDRNTITVLKILFHLEQDILLNLIRDRNNYLLDNEITLTSFDSESASLFFDDVFSQPFDTYEVSRYYSLLECGLNPSYFQLFTLSKIFTERGISFNNQLFMVLYSKIPIEKLIEIFTSISIVDLNYLFNTLCFFDALHNPRFYQVTTTILSRKKEILEFITKNIENQTLIYSWLSVCSLEFGVREILDNLDNVSADWIALIPDEIRLQIENQTVDYKKINILCDEIEEFVFDLVTVLFEIDASLLYISHLSSLKLHNFMKLKLNYDRPSSELSSLRIKQHSI